jgi:DtxR family Mn-dependent transcriptional regulator
MRKKTMEEYIETIYVLEKREDSAHTSQIALELGVKPPTVTEMLQKLEDDKLIKYQAYLGATLTAKGRRMAKELMIKHRVIADFLEIIEVDKELAELDACQIEHHVSKETLQQLEKFVNFVKSHPGKPRWMQHFKEFSKTGENRGCRKFEK